VIETTEVLSREQQSSGARTPPTTHGSMEGKPWRYLLIPDDGIQDNFSLEWLVLQYGE